MQAAPKKLCVLCEMSPRPVWELYHKAIRCGTSVYVIMKYYTTVIGSNGCSNKHFTIRNCTLNLTGYKRLTHLIIDVPENWAI
jgi:hypothetical protein